MTTYKSTEKKFFRNDCYEYRVIVEKTREYFDRANTRVFENCYDDFNNAYSRYLDACETNMREPINLEDSNTCIVATAKYTVKITFEYHGHILNTFENVSYRF